MLCRKRKLRPVNAALGRATVTRSANRSPDDPMAFPEDECDTGDYDSGVLSASWRFSLFVRIFELGSAGAEIDRPGSRLNVARVLVAESDQHIREFFAGILADCGHAVQTCADATEAPSSLAKREIDVVVTDLVLEIGDETTLFRDCAALGIPTFTLSGSKFRPGQLLAERPAALLEKPFRFNDLQTVLDAVALQPEPA